MTGTFIDSNIILYLQSSDERKARIVQKEMLSGGIVSVQVLSEVTSVLHRKLRVPWSEINDFLSLVQQLLRVEDLTIQVHSRARKLAQQYGLNFYDAQIVSSALLAGCTTLLTEDMQHELVVEGVLRILNPFL